MEQKLDKERIVRTAKSVFELCIILGVNHIIGKERKKKLSQYKSFLYNEQDGDGYIKRAVYKYQGDYYY
jgi:hypothetical protein